MNEIDWKTCRFLKDAAEYEAELAKAPLKGRDISIIHETLVQRGNIAEIVAGELVCSSWAAEIPATNGRPSKDQKWILKESPILEHIDYNWERPSGPPPRVYGDGTIGLPKGFRMIIIHTAEDKLDPAILETTQVCEAKLAILLDHASNSERDRLVEGYCKRDPWFTRFLVHKGHAEGAQLRKMIDAGSKTKIERVTKRGLSAKAMLTLTSATEKMIIYIRFEPAWGTFVLSYGLGAA
jgi:hypothetical protein